jgi:divinyl chlorophyllide a 8-vinyl-reductase
VVCFIRAKAGVNGKLTLQDWEAKLPGVIFRTGDVTDSKSLFQDGFAGEHFDTVLSCLASRTGNPKDAWAIDHAAHMLALHIAQNSGVKHFVLLSAICVQKPLLAFQHAKLAFEDALISSGMSYAIVRPTAFFKSLCGQIERVRKGKPFLVFGNGQLTACKPISDQDLGNYLAQCVSDPALHNRILPIGGPGPAITPLQQGEYLFSLLGQTPKYSHVPVKMMDVIIGALSLLGYLIPALAQKAELARIGRYYATESMLVWDTNLGRYDANATPSTGQETLWDCYQSLVSGQTSLERGDHAVF